MSKTILKVQTLGKLEISDGVHVYPTGNRKRAQVELLVIYLLMNRQRHVSSSQIIDFLWPDGDSDKPEGALRNLVYRARQEMRNFGTDDLCIQSKGHSYFWNQNVECQVDYEEIVTLSLQVAQERNHHIQFLKCMDLIGLLESEFLPELQYNGWVEAQRQNLENRCVETILKTIENQIEDENYENILEITMHPHLQDIIDARLYETRLYAYYKAGKIDNGLTFYRQIVDHYYSQYGIEVTPRLKEIYQKILDTSPATQVDVDNLEKSLIDGEDKGSTFYCDFDIFKNIYQLNLRSVRRSMKARVLVLLTLCDSSQQLTEKEIQGEAQILRKVIADSLRKNDVFSKFNMTQYSLIIASPHLQGAQKAVNRIIEHYEEKKKHETTYIIHQLKQII